MVLLEVTQFQRSPRKEAVIRRKEMFLTFVGSFTVGGFFGGDAVSAKS